MTVIALVSVINHYHINRLNAFWDTLYLQNIFNIIIDYQYSLLLLIIFMGVLQNPMEFMSVTATTSGPTAS